MEGFRCNSNVRDSYRKKGDILEMKSYDWVSKIKIIAVLSALYLTFAASFCFAEPIAPTEFQDAIIDAFTEIDSTAIKERMNKIT